MLVAVGLPLLGFCSSSLVHPERVAMGALFRTQIPLAWAGAALGRKLRL